MAASHCIPLELITEILTNLPAKSLYRFKCVSKPWYTLTSSSKFIKLHLTKTLINSNTNFNIIVTNNQSLLSSAISNFKLRFNVVNHPLYNLSHRPPVELIESVHGILLISDFPKKTVFLFNPSNKTHRLIPPAPSRKPDCVFGLVEVFGFGYDSATDDYKVVKLSQWLDSGLGMCRETCVLYSMRNDSWKSVNDETVLYHLQQMNGVAVDGILCFSVVSRDFKPVLKFFDLRTNKFSLVNYPELDNYELGKMTISLRNLGGCLCLLVNYQKYKVDPDKFMGDPLYNRVFLYADVWELNVCGKKESWVKLFRIRKNEIHKHCMYLRLVTYSKDEKSVLVEVDGFWFGLYNLVNKKMEEVSVQGLRVEDSPYVAFTYVDSLILVVNNKVVSEKEGTTRPKKTIRKNDFLSTGFKLKL